MSCFQYVLRCTHGLRRDSRVKITISIEKKKSCSVDSVDGAKMFLSVFFAVLCCILVFVLWCAQYKIKFKPLKDIPGPAPKPIIGNVLDVGQNTVDQIRNFYEMQKQYGNFYRLWIGPNQFIIIVTDADFMEFLLNTPKLIYKEFGYEMLYPWMGRGLLTSNGSYWHSHRKLLTPAFHFKILEGFLPIFHKNGEILIEKLKKKINNKGFEIYMDISMYALDVICETSMGTSINAQENADHPYIKGVELVRAKTIERMFSAWQQSDFLFKFASCYKDYTKSLRGMHDFVRGVIEKRKKLIENDALVKETEDEFGIKKRNNFLDILLRASINGQPLSDEEIREEVDTFMFEGHDTTSSAVFFALYSMAKHPEVQQNLYEELVPIYDSDTHKKLTFEDMNQMKYLDCVIKETLRLYPSAPYFSRTLEQDTYYKDLLMPKGTAFILFVYGMHRDPKYFNDPLKFNPDRFLTENMDKNNNFTYIPFSAGARNCIGQKYAMYEMKSIISKLIHTFEISLVNPDVPLVLSAETVLKATGDILFNFKLRQN